MKPISKPSLALIAAAMVLVGCASKPQDGQDSTAYYYSSGKRAPSSAAVTPVTVPPANTGTGGPANVARIIYFDFDSAEIRPEYRSVVEAHGNYLRSNPRSQVLLTGHTDPRGGAEYNLALGQRRAQSVERALTQQGVSNDRLEAVSYGKERPASTEATESGYQLNRRVELVYR
ncbi:peptidoglycan-associated lipoprotein [Comamonas sp. BIGb0124]|uniref:peptidoglycan-associated lipoprotein Pal n=1 Tax=Comamonas sp. BIGb0124 TaxID=2485130 RepID=UPI000F49D525|nr:peptidoglycan-associated lipoprotein Pal [Comamonas sp. BIGb0124]ROR21431.1 peptidoglycan-associated lipoprotein [Comamonas sp. BIGb0124]